MQAAESRLIALREALLCEVSLEIRIGRIGYSLRGHEIGTDIAADTAGRDLIPDLTVTAGRLAEDRDGAVIPEGGHQLTRGAGRCADIDVRPADDRRLCRIRGRKCIQRGSGGCQQKAE